MALEIYWEEARHPFWFLEAPANELARRCAKEGVRGVYMWVCSIGNRCWIDYIGKATGSPTLIRRQQEHVENQLGLRYRIPKEFMPGDEDWVPGVYPKNTAWLLDPHKRALLIDAARTYLDASTVFLAPQPEMSSQELRLLERNLLWDLQPLGTTPGTKTPPKEQQDIVHVNAGWYSEALENKFQREIQVR